MKKIAKKRYKIPLSIEKMRVQSQKNESVKRDEANEIWPER